MWEKYHPNEPLPEKYKYIPNDPDDDKPRMRMFFNVLYFLIFIGVLIFVVFFTPFKGIRRVYFRF
jgi:hypothetical protein